MPLATCSAIRNNVSCVILRDTDDDDELDDESHHELGRVCHVRFTMLAKIVAKLPLGGVLEHEIVRAGAVGGRAEETHNVLVLTTRQLV